MARLDFLARGARHVGTFFVHFAHGGFLATGIIVLGLISVQLSRHGIAGLSFDHFALGRASASADEEGGVLDDLSAGSQLTPDFQRVSKYLARRYKIAPSALEPIILEAQRSGKAFNLDPLLLLAIASIESSFNPLAESAFGAQGLMQVVPRFHTEKISPERGALALFDPVENVRVGALVLKEYVRSSGSLEVALQQYGGASDDPSMAYSLKVQAELQRLQGVRGGGAAAPATPSQSAERMRATAS